jgi:hypothetical protein
MTQRNVATGSPRDEEAFLNYRMAVASEMPDSAYKRAVLEAIESRRRACAAAKLAWSFQPK